MSRAMIIGAGGVAGVVINKCCQNSDVFTEIMIASRTKAKCDAFKEKLQPTTKTVISTAQVDADNVEELTALIKSYNPEIVINVALPYQDLHIMDACLAAGVNYLDTANYEPEDTAKFEYSWQWAYRERFEKAGLTAILGCGFDPGVTGVFSAYAMKHQFDEINYIDILDCNGGDHGYPFATNFNPEINIREVSANGSYIEDGKWVETKPMEIKRVYNFKGVGEKDMYLLHHEELESLALNIKGIKRIRFFMTFGQSYLTHLKCLEDVGMTSIKPIMYEGKEIVPLQFLKAVLPDPASLGPRTVRIYVILDRSYLMIHEIFLSGDVPREAPDAVIYRDDIRVEAADKVAKRVQRRYLAACCDVDVNAERGNSLVRVILREGVHRDMTFVKMCVNGIRLDTVPVKEAGALVAGAVNMFGVNMSLRKENIDRGPLRIIILL